MNKTLWIINEYAGSPYHGMEFRHFIASNFPLWKEIVEGNNCGICVNPLDTRDIAKAIKHLIDNPDEAREMGENGRKAVLEKYN